MAGTIRELLAQATTRLKGVSDSPDLDAQVLLCHVLQRDRGWLYTWPEYSPDARQLAAFTDLLDARAAGQPIAYLTGEREFWSLPLTVDEHTLIPRPETEQLVEIALDLSLPDTARVLDLGTGSGAIALALATQRPNWQVTAVDTSAYALAVARHNADRLGVGRLVLLQSDWFSALPTNASFDLVVGNPPYVAANDPHLAQGDVRFEPRAALVSGADGLDDLRGIVSEAPKYLRAGAWLWLEHGYQQDEVVRELLRQRGFGAITSHTDLAGLPRHTGGQWPGD